MKKKNKDFQNFKFALMRMGFNKESICDNLPDYLDNVSSEELRKMSIEKIYFTYKVECEEWLSEQIV